MYGSDQVTEGTEEQTEFRKAEKKYKLYYQNNLKLSKKKKQPKEVDLSEVIDFKSILHSFNEKGELPNGVFATETEFGCPVFCLENRPGFYFIPGALSVEEQCHWIKENLTSFPQPPNRTNHNALYGPISDLFAAAKERKILVEEASTEEALDSGIDSHDSSKDSNKWKFLEEPITSLKGNTCKSVLASVLLRKLRWSTLGLQFDWSQRNYNVALPHNKIPKALSELAKRMAAPAMSIGEEFKPEAAIVNYFGSGDTLGGHLDDMEADWSKPIVSMSLGCKAIFLLGGKSRHDSPTAMFLRSGDIVLMAGVARECFHGVPRIFTGEVHTETNPLESLLSQKEDACFLEYIRTSRININIRQPYEVMSPVVLTQLATGLSVLAGAAIVKTLTEKPMAGPFPRCPSCNGTGRVGCMCSRWSDGDVGCRSCSGSGQMPCRSCGGSGTGRALPVQLSVRSQNRPS